MAARPIVHTNEPRSRWMAHGTMAPRMDVATLDLSIYAIYYHYNALRNFVFCFAMCLCMRVHYLYIALRGDIRMIIKKN